MKKLNLKLGGIKEMLTREQMKKVVGGDYGGDCPANECDINNPCSGGRYCQQVACNPGGQDRTVYFVCV